MISLASCNEISEKINQNVNEWVMRYNSEYEDRKTTDYGQILFPENDRRSWYIRFPFEPVLSLDQQQQIATPLLSKPTVQQLLRRTPLFPQISQHSLAWHIVQFMRTAWNLPTPELIISVTGGAKLCNLTREMSNAFQQALISAVLTTDAWIFTGGTDSGVMKEVGNAIDKCRQKNIPCIGICSWYYTTDYEQLEQNRDPTTTTDTNLSEVTESFPLDTNHTHFLLLDDMCGANDGDWKKMYSLSKEDEHKSEIPRRADLTLKLRAEIEQEARKTTDDKHKSLIPIVQILVDDGQSSILTMCEAVALRTSVIVIQGTMRAADRTAEVYNMLYPSNSGERSIEEYRNRQEARKTFASEYKEMDDSIINKTNRKKFIDMMTSENGYFLINVIQFRPEVS
ncbi:unnamed protein product [Didymodactylos carnosus]|uniref:TRPM SLOG domain-containing protein n=1 Tax=Didymodactylos carnosus TaxID=1234261 RepID=A0A814E8A9_9BILA|nr:unnamed protein product [Didymodactylos carnosus]CAF0964477.1 unnamed protein product [Didymodactylos carnosus]CAF3580928.1 unnamed protein product [Didymodactylos carnosus]CAF3738204.1 unnamed protein product [Didymodactylos carnosus]